MVIAAVAVALVLGAIAIGQRTGTVLGTISSSAATTPLGCSVRTDSYGAVTADLRCTHNAILLRGCNTDISSLPVPQNVRDGPEPSVVWLYSDGAGLVAMVRANVNDRTDYINVVSIRNGCTFTLTDAEWETLGHTGGPSLLPSKLL